MPLVRIITRNPDDARELHDQLVERGYQVEYADPSSLISKAADLEIDLQRLPMEEGLRAAHEWAASAGADVYVAAQVLPAVESAPAVAPPVAEEPQIHAEQAAAEESYPEQQYEHPGEPEPIPEISSAVPLTFTQPEESPQPESEPSEQPAATSEHLRQAVANAAGIFADSLHDTKESVSQGFSDLKQRLIPEREPSRPSLLERWSHSLAERRALRQEKKNRERETARLVRDERTRREARAEALAQDLRELRAREAESRPQVVQGSVAPVMHQHVHTRPAMQPVLERRMNAPRRDAHRDEGAEYWRGAFTGAAVVAVVLMIAWATLGTSHPPAPSHSTGQIKQDVPFGPVTLMPSVSTAKPAASSPVSARPATPSPKPAAIAPTPKPASVRSHRARRSTGSSAVADDVVVRHFGPQKPATTPSNATAKNTGPKHISDQ